MIALLSPLVCEVVPVSPGEDCHYQTPRSRRQVVASTSWTHYKVLTGSPLPLTHTPPASADGEKV